jgi:hypothetical protein
LKFEHAEASTALESAVRSVIDDSPRLGVFLGVYNIMMQLHVHNERCRARDAKQELCEAKAARLDEIEQRRSIPKE